MADEDPAKTLPPVHLLGLGLPADGGGLAPSCAEHLLLRGAEVLIGGRAQLEALPELAAERLVVDSDVEALYGKIRRNREAGRTQTALCSGDPLYFGLGSRLAERFGPGAVSVAPALSSLQGAAACLGLPWEAVRSVSLHGRSSFMPLAHALIGGGPVFVLTGPAVGAAEVAAWMLERGCGHYRMHIVDDLAVLANGTVSAGQRRSLELEEAAQSDGGGGMRVLFLEPLGPAPARPFGLNDAEIAREKKLLTKGPIRAAALAALGIEPGHTVWDLGAGSGAVSIEAARLAWQGQVFAVERKAERAALITANRRRFAAVNLEIVEADMPDCLPLADAPGKAALPRPDRIFIGGGLGGDAERTRETLVRAWAALRPGGRLLADCVLLASLERCRATLLELGAELSVTCLHASTSSPLATDMRLEALNPVFLVLGEKENRQ